jgi:hypothetical protein
MPDNPVNADNSFATGVDATHIGPETGSTGAATAGGASGAGVHGNVSPAPAAGIGRTLERDEEFEDHDEEPRSFDPPHKTAAADDGDLGDMGDAPEALKRATDGDEQKSKPVG